MINTRTEITKTINEIKESLVNEGLDSIMRGSEWMKLMSLMCDDIRTSAKKANSESEVAFDFDRVLVNLSDELLVPSGFDGYVPLRERSVELTEIEGEETTFQTVKKRGRIDSKYSNVVIEYKQPSKYKNDAEINKAEKQALDYLKALNVEDEGEYAAIVTDGLRCQFIEWSYGEYSCEPIREIDEYSLDRIVKSIIKLTVKTLTSKNLIDDLVIAQHSGNNLVNRLTECLYESLKDMNRSTTIAYESWLDNFGLSHDDASQQQAIEERRRDLGKLIDKAEIKADEEYKILFALQTSTAIVAMLIAYKAVSVIKGDKKIYSLSLLHNIGANYLRIELSNMAGGSISSKIHIYNLLEIGCFSWAFQEDHWSEQIYRSINDIIETLLKYENMPDLTANTDDLFRELYMAIMPTSVRHSLGEYYTPKWLAENVIESGLKYLPYDRKKHMRVLDSAAGSGTFPQIAIEIKKEEYKKLDNDEALDNILSEVASIDANVLAVILARINYFISISNLVDRERKLYIPVYIGDSTVSNVEKRTQDGKYYKEILQDAEGEPLEVRFPVEALDDKEEFIDTLKTIEDLAEDIEKPEIEKQLKRICINEEDVGEMTEVWMDLVDRGMITTSVVSRIIDYFLLCSLGKFDLIVGNPPWVDWKSLPSVHREKIKNACVSRDLFSGDGRTGGINLNVCALLSNISAENWLADGGVMSILMPQSILFQQSYEGYRNLKIADGRRLFFQEIIDWEKAGHPFYPVQQLFATYIMTEDKQDYFSGIPAKCIKLKKGNKLENIFNKINRYSFDEYFDVDEKILGRTTQVRTAFTYAKDEKELSYFQKISGETEYYGREGVEYYPQELQLFKIKGIDLNKGTVQLETYKNSRSKYSIGVRTPEIETTYLRPLIKGVCISRFHVEPSDYIVAFPYDKEHYKIPLNKRELREQSPLLYGYYKENREYLEMQTGYSDSIIGSSEAEYYALARTGLYSHAPWYVIFRDNTKWVSAVVGEMDTEWGGVKSPAFQNHCVSISQRPDGTFISEDEAHYICAILNSHIVEDFILSTSDKRTFKIRLPIQIKLFENNKIQKKLATLSKKAHENYDDTRTVEDIRCQIDELYIETL